MTAGRSIVAIGLLMAAGYLAATLMWPKPEGRLMFGDATHHFVQLRSLVFDRDLQFGNEYTRLYGLTGQEGPELAWISRDLTKTGHVRNYMPIGPPLLWAPLYLLFAGIKAGLAALKLTRWPDGYDRLLQLAPGLTGIAAATAGVWFSWRLARRFSDSARATIAVIALWLGSQALYYTLVSPTYSHAASMLTAGIFFWRWLGGAESPASFRRIAELGALAGFCALMRWQDAIFLIAPIWMALSWHVAWTQRLAAITAAIGAAAIVFSPQMVVWKVLYGQAFTVPQGPSFMQWTSPHFVDVLFSDQHGLFSWTPLVLIALLGTVPLIRSIRRDGVALVTILAASWYVNAAVADWYAGEAFGQRRFLSMFPVFTIGLAVWLPAARSRVRSLKLATVVILVVANWLLLLQYELFMKGYRAIAPYPRAWFDLWAARFVVPFRLLRLMLR